MADINEQVVQNTWKRYTLIAAVVGALSGGGVTAILTFFTDWVDMNSRPGEIIYAADLAPGLQGTVQVVIEDQEWIIDIICKHHKEEC